MLSDQRELDKTVNNMYINKVKKCGQWRTKQAIRRTKECIRQCKEMLQELPKDQYWQNELEFYKDRLKILNQLK